MNKVDILIVEDDELYVDMLGMAFEMSDCIVNIKSFEKSDDAIKYYSSLDKNNRPDICLIDINLPTSTFDGFETIAKIKKMNNTTIICETGSTSKADILKAKKMGSVAVLHKDGDYDVTVIELLNDLEGLRNGTIDFKIYK